MTTSPGVNRTNVAASRERDSDIAKNRWHTLASRRSRQCSRCVDDEFVFDDIEHEIYRCHLRRLAVSREVALHRADAHDPCDAADSIELELFIDPRVRFDHRPIGFDAPLRAVWFEDFNPHTAADDGAMPGRHGVENSLIVNLKPREVLQVSWTVQSLISEGSD